MRSIHHYATGVERRVPGTMGGTLCYGKVWCWLQPYNDMKMNDVRGDFIGIRYVIFANLYIYIYGCLVDGYIC